MTTARDVALVLPVYNEDECVAAVIDGWLQIFQRLKIKSVVIAINDGSSDGTAAVLERYDGHEHVLVQQQDNMGHGPTILRGYQQAMAIAPWVMQCDSDNEISAAEFPRFWEMRENYDALFGLRQKRQQTWARKVISFVSRWMVYRLFGSAVVDVNVPFRLLRSELLQQILSTIPANTVAPNMLIAAVCSLKRVRVANLSVTHRQRRTGRGSLLRWKLWRSAARSFVQTLHWYWWQGR